MLTGLQSTILRLMMEAPDKSTEIPAIKPDGTEGNMLTETFNEVLMKPSPWHDSAENNISGPLIGTV